VASIAHRASGVLLVIATPLLIYLLDLSLHQPQAFRELARPFAEWPGRLLLLVPAWALAYHLLAGLRHLALDLGLGEARPRARASAWLVLAAGALVALGVTL
jgi:succinate dehydrogenase / fumarate reductase cytochrome b subunit